MLFSDGDLDKIFEYFNRDPRVQLLCVLALGGSSDEQFIENVIKAAPALDVITNKSTHLFLFWDSPKNRLRLTFASAGRSDEGYLLPGMHFGGERFIENRFRSAHLGLEEIDLSDQDVKRDIKLHSQLITRQIVDKYDLEPSDFPCMLTFYRSAHDPVIFRMTKHTDVLDIMNLLSSFSYVVAGSAEARIRSMFGEVQRGFKKVDEKNIRAWLKKEDNALSKTIIQLKGIMQKSGVEISVCDRITSAIKSHHGPLDIAVRDIVLSDVRKSTGADKKIENLTEHPSFLTTCEAVEKKLKRRERKIKMANR